MTIEYFVAETIFDGDQGYRNSALVVSSGRVAAVLKKADVPTDAKLTDFGHLMIAPGFVDLQVNGGGGVLLNDAPCVETIRTICNAHRPFGTTSLLATLITDRPDVTSAALAAGMEAARLKISGFAGLHIEGPHLSKVRKGTHDPQLIRAMNDADLAQLIAAKSHLPTLFVTIAPESVTLEQVAQLSEAGVVVSLGHSDVDFETAMRYFDAGARCATHLFNAMSQLTNRAPGLVGAALSNDIIHAGIIADGHHVHDASMAIALRAKTGPGKLHLVTDAMSTVGSDIQSFTLNGREIRRTNGRLTLADGTLAGADVSMISCVRYVHETLSIPAQEALRMASKYPAQCIGRETDIGTLRVGARADFICLNDKLVIQSVSV